MWRWGEGVEDGEGVGGEWFGMQILGLDGGGGRGGAQKVGCSHMLRV